jgi:transcriptional regulator with XRE-family HTH domain
MCAYAATAVGNPRSSPRHFLQAASSDFLLCALVASAISDLVMRSEPEATLAEAVREGAQRAGLSIRRLARRSGVSAAQINRIRAEEVERPSLDTVLSLARALDRNPNLLFVVSGHVGEEEARDLLRRAFADGAELNEVWKVELGRDVSAVRLELDDPATTITRLRRIALDVFLAPEAQENLWQDPYLGSAVQGSDARALRELLQRWAYLSAERKTRVIEYVRDQSELARFESTNEMRQETPDYGKP